MSSLPVLPSVQSETTLAIFIHQSLQSSPTPNERFGDAERLAFIGERVLQMALAEILFEKRPMLSAIELEVSAPLDCSNGHRIPALIPIRHRTIKQLICQTKRTTSGLPNTSCETRLHAMLSNDRN